jgi:hypothetical protein
MINYIFLAWIIISWMIKIHCRMKLILNAFLLWKHASHLATCFVHQIIESCIVIGKFVSVLIIFMRLYDIIRDHPIFTSPKKRRSQVAIQLQLLIFLYKLSSSGTGGKFTRIGEFFRISKGFSAFNVS